MYPLAWVLGLRMNLVHVDFVADITMRSGSFWVVEFFAVNDQTECCSFFGQLGAIPGGSSAPSCNGGLECYPGPKVKQEAGS